MPRQSLFSRNRFYFVLWIDPGGAIHGETRQLEMANTSPRHMPVLGNVHPIKIVFYFIFRDVISLRARAFIFLIGWATQEVPMKSI